MRIAYVEDNAINQSLVQRIATMGGHVITSFTEGEIALVELVRQPFDLILMDIELAGEMNGLQVVQHLRARGLTTPIVAVTAYAMLGDQEKTLEAGCNDYLPKPIPIGDFLALLARYESQLASTQPPATSPDADMLPTSSAVGASLAPVEMPSASVTHAETPGQDLSESRASVDNKPVVEALPVNKSTAERQKAPPPPGVPDTAKATGT